MTVTDLRLLRGATAATHRGAGSAPDSNSETRDDTERVFRCRTCGAKIADAKSLFPATDGRSRHVFANPTGKVFEIVTVLVAEGLTVHGPPTLEFTWFPGYAWRVVTCARCGTHLGWTFEATAAARAPRAFYGLLTTELVEGP